MSFSVVVSIGYEGRSPEELLRLLLSSGVRKLLDVRELPLSRRKGFSKTPLARTLAEAGIEYRHLKYAGNPYRKLKKDIQECLRLYSNYLGANPDVVESVQREIEDGPVAMLCCERDPSICHRGLLLERLRISGARIHVVEPK